jgi:2-polyprenyl-6-methoxyphenol hydroxylase-like FAD-dependent oxidoreductase
VKQMRILIVGGGIAGLAMARALQQRGLQPQVVERATEWPEAGTGIYIPANGLRALKDLGLDEAVVSRGLVITRQRFLNHRGSLLLDIDLEDFWGACGPCLAIHRRDLHDRLVAGTSELPLRFGTAVESIQQQDGGARAIFSDGSSGDFDVIVGADGMNSTIRRLAFGGNQPRRVGQVSWRFLVDGFPEIDAWTVMLGKGQTFLTIPLGQGRVYCYCDIGSALTDDPTGGDAGRLRELFRGFADPVPRILDNINVNEDIYFSPIEEIDQEPSVKGRVVLVGDAAHGMSPNMAQGASLALEDAIVLAETISEQSSPDESLSSFALRRSPRISGVREATHRRDKTRALPPTLRDILLRVAGRKIFSAHYRPLLQKP